MRYQNWEDFLAKGLPPLLEGTTSIFIAAAAATAIEGVTAVEKLAGGHPSLHLAVGTVRYPLELYLEGEAGIQKEDKLFVLVEAGNNSVREAESFIWRAATHRPGATIVVVSTLRDASRMAAMEQGDDAPPLINVLIPWDSTQPVIPRCLSDIATLWGKHLAPKAVVEVGAADDGRSQGG